MSAGPDGLLTPEEAAHRAWLEWYARTRPGLPRGVPGRQVDGAPGDEYAPMPGYSRIVAVRRGGDWVGWTEVRSLPGLACGRDLGGAGCADRNCPTCPDRVAEARARGFAFVEGGWP